MGGRQARPLLRGGALVAVALVALTEGAARLPKLVRHRRLKVYADPLLRCFTPRAFATAVRADQYPIRSGSAGALAAPREPFGGGTVAVVLRGIFATPAYEPPASSVYAGGYPKDPRVTFPSLRDYVLAPMRKDGVVVDLYVASPRAGLETPFAREALAWLQREWQPEAVWAMDPAHKQFSYVTDAVVRARESGLARGRQYTAYLVVRADMLWMPTAYLVLRGNHNASAIQTKAHRPGPMGTALDDLHLVPAALLEAFQGWVRRYGRAAMHKVPGDVVPLLDPFLPGCDEFCCNLVGINARGAPFQAGYRYEDHWCVRRAQSVLDGLARTGRANSSANMDGSKDALRWSNGSGTCLGTGRLKRRGRELKFCCNPF